MNATLRREYVRRRRAPLLAAWDEDDIIPVPIVTTTPATTTPGPTTTPIPGECCCKCWTAAPGFGLLGVPCNETGEPGCVEEEFCFYLETAWPAPSGGLCGPAEISCEEPTTTPGPTTSPPTTGPTTTPPLNTCNECDPPLPNTLYVTFSGLGGEYASLNGKWPVYWTTQQHRSCFWLNTLVTVPGGQSTTLSLGWTNLDTGLPGWSVELGWRFECRLDWQGPLLAQCAPAAAYALAFCDDTGCVDTNTCALSAGATCVVSNS